MQSFVRNVMLLFVLVVTGTARADSDPFKKPTSETAREHLSLGNKLFNVRDFEKAVEEYKAGALVEPAPIFDYNLGQCYRELGRYDDAIWHYERFVKRGQPTGKVLAAVNNFVDQMKAEREQRARSQPPTDVAPSASSDAHQEPTLPSSSPGASTGVISADAIRTEAPNPRGTDWFGIGLVGTGGVAGVVGGVLIWDARSLRNDANDTVVQSQRITLHDRADTRALTGTIVGVAGAALIVTGVTKLVLNRGPRDQRATVTWDVSPTSNGVLVFGSF